MVTLNRSGFSHYGAVSLSDRRKIVYIVVGGLSLAILLLVGRGGGGPVQGATIKRTSLSNYSPMPVPVQVKRQGSYVPAPIEDYIMKNSETLGYKEVYADGCEIWKISSKEEDDEEEEKKTTNYDLPTHDLHGFLQDLDDYADRISHFPPIPDLRPRMDSNKDICKTLSLLHGEGYTGPGYGSHAVFQNGQLSWLNRTGFIEPLLPPLRHPSFCTNPLTHWNSLLYLVHDFETMCRNLKKTSRTVLFDLGASLEFHSRHHGKNPALYLIETYSRFGFQFDHIYAYEVTPFDPIQVYNKFLPEHLLASYHWINVGVDTDPKSKLNPWKMIKETFDPDDLVVVKLDVDVVDIESKLVQQLLDDEDLHPLIDHFYFEHHIKIQQFKSKWRKVRPQGTIKESMELFTKLRQKGIAAHYWV